MHQFRLNITCGKHARDVDECGGDIAALQAQATLTLRQASRLDFNSIMVSAPPCCASHVMFLLNRRHRLGRQRGGGHLLPPVSRSGRTHPHG